MHLIAGYTICQIALFAILLWGRIVLRRFLRAHRAIYDYAALSAFKEVVRLNMLCALAFLMFGVMLLVWGVFLATHYGVTGLTVVIASSLPPIALGLGTKSMDSRARSLDCTDPDLRREYERVSEIWVKKAMPHF